MGGGPGGGGRHRKLHFSKIYSYTCRKTTFKEDHSHIGGPRFSRVVYCNEADCFEAVIRNYIDNYVRTTKYTLATFLPKSLFEQFRSQLHLDFVVLNFDQLELDPQWAGICNGMAAGVMLAASFDLIQEG
ncbi:hypothetical protein Q3G72_005701 [Acer saccharum]|nr:hypothetical protein Q3G72_005701 [Acer saccharum]